MSSKLVFCDEAKKPVALWNPVGVGLSGARLIENTPTRVDGLALTNTGTATVKVSAVRITTTKDGTQVRVFSLLSPQSFDVDPGELYWVDVKYVGSGGGPLDGLVEVDCDDPVSPTVSLPLATTVKSLGKPGELTLDPASIDFGPTPVGTTKIRNLQVKNSGDHVVVIEEVTVSGSGGQLEVGVGQQSLVPGGVETLPVSYTPTAAASADGVLSIKISSRFGGSSLFKMYEVPLDGSGHMPTIFLAAGPEPSGPFASRGRELKALNFGLAPPNTDVARSFWVVNLGNAPLTVYGTDVPKGPLQIPNTDGNVFPFTLAPGAEREVGCLLRTSPFGGGSVVDKVALASDDPIRMRVPLTGRGRSEGPHLTEPDVFKVELVEVAQPGGTTLVFTSDGTSDVTVRKIRMSIGTEFTVSASPLPPNRSLAPGTTLTLTITALNPLQADQLIVEHDGTGRGTSASVINVSS